MDDTPSTLAPAGSDIIFRPLRTGNVFEETFERLVQAIKLGVVPLGSRLPPERELATRLNVSRTTLREAIRALEQMGFVEVRQGRGGGTFAVHRASAPPSVAAREIVQKMGPKLDDLLDFRQALEPAAAELAARRAIPGSAGRLREHLAEIRHSSLAEYRIADARFHLAIADLARAPSLAASIADVQLRIADPLAALPPWDESLRHSDDQHEALIDAIDRNDPERARTVMAEHIAATATLLRGLQPQ
ncbi:FadR/GntR family transcriptional regulator [Patulibacter defluvii]|uniref:FadR/GntR family transcriptional regulator n=1 Tax=Patulibacter defluvii TaxID=3095358 RepID=UPI002A758ACF|nr:FCD domain-containing protein [Patulibacter sp. DM4]